MLNIKNLNEVMTANYPPREWIIEDMLAKGSLTMLSGQPRSYKTFITLAMALAVAKGEKLFNAFDTKPTGVLILDEESGDQLMYERFKALGATESLDNLPIYFSFFADRKMNKDYAEEVIKFCQEKDIGLVIVDCLTRFHNGNENDAGDMSRILGDFKRIAVQGITCLIIHHERKRGYSIGNSADAMRGSSDIFAACDIQMSVERKGLSNMITIEQNKLRYGKEKPAITITINDFEDGRISLDFSGQAKTKKDEHDSNKQTVLQFIRDNEGLNKSEVERALQEQNHTLSQAKIRRCIVELLAENLIREDTANNSKNAHLLYLNNN